MKENIYTYNCCEFLRERQIGFFFFHLLFFITHWLSKVQKLRKQSFTARCFSILHLSKTMFRVLTPPPTLTLFQQKYSSVQSDCTLGTALSGLQTPSSLQGNSRGPRICRVQCQGQHLQLSLYLQKRKILEKRDAWSLYIRAVGISAIMPHSTCSMFSKNQGFSGDGDVGYFHDYLPRAVCVPVNHISSGSDATTSSIATLLSFLGGFKNYFLRDVTQDPISFFFFFFF